MKPVAIIQHMAGDEPGHIAVCLRERGIDYQVIRVDQGEPLPTTAGDLAGLVSIGGAMGANDPLPWIADELRLMRAADAARVPIAGHCLGAQLMARAFGATVTKNPVREHGWAELTIDNPALAREWLGDCADTPITALQWHADTFSLPPGAQRILSGRYCANQAFVLRDRHLAVQSHFEIEPAQLRGWAEKRATLIAETVARDGVGPTQPVTAILAEVEQRTAAGHRVLERLYERWLRGISPHRRRSSV